MTAAQFLSALKRGIVAPAYLFLGPDLYQRRRCREALINAMLQPDERENGLVRHDAGAMELAEIVDDACTLSLFAPQRVIVVSNAEAALPQAKAAAQEDDENEPAGASGPGDAAPLARYMKNPTPGVVLLFEASRFDFEGEDKKRSDRVRRFYSAISDAVEMRRHTLDEAREEARMLAQRAKLSISADVLEFLIESLGADVTRIAVEIEKLSLFAQGRPIEIEDIAALAPDACATTIFALVNALGRRDRARSLQVLDTLVRDGEYLPLALAFLSTQFRCALAAREAGLRGSFQIQGHFTKLGMPMWPSRAEQIGQTMTRFSSEGLTRGLQLIFEADRDLRSARPDDRIVMERFVLELTR